MKDKKTYHIFRIIIIILAYIAVITVFDIGCPFKHFIGIPCPTCGVTRAILALLRLDIKASMEYNPMALFLAVSFLIIVINDVIRKRWHWTNYIAVCFAVMNIIVYAFKLFVLIFIC